MTHVLAVRLDNDGDVLLAGPALRALAAGADRLTVLCGPRGRQAAQLLEGIDEIVCWRAPWIDPEPDALDAGDVLALAGRLAERRARVCPVVGHPCLRGLSADAVAATVDRLVEAVAV
jgi:ADP-heptose:LPS heptosyltransferase